MADEITVRDETESQEDGVSKKGGCFRAFLVILVIVVILWFIQPVQTGVGEMSRFRATRIYLHLALVVKPAGFDPLNGACAKAYGNGIYKSLVGFVLLPSYGVATINTWLGAQIRSIKDRGYDAPSIGEVWDLLEPVYEDQLREMVPVEPVPINGDMCHLPRASTWTQDLMP
jgi:hypothetical protein